MLALLLLLPLFGVPAVAFFPKPIALLSGILFLFFLGCAWRIAVTLLFAWRRGYLLRLGEAGIDGLGLRQQLPWNAVLGIDVVEEVQGGRSWPNIRVLMRTAEPRYPSWALMRLGRVLRKGNELVLTGSLWSANAASLRKVVPEVLRRYAPDADAEWRSGQTREWTLERLRLREREREAKQQADAAMEVLRRASPAEANSALAGWQQLSSQHLGLIQQQIERVHMDRERQSKASVRAALLCLAGVLVLIPCWFWWR